MEIKLKLGLDGQEGVNHRKRLAEGCPVSRDPRRHRTESGLLACAAAGREGPRLARPRTSGQQDLGPRPSLGSSCVSRLLLGTAHIVSIQAFLRKKALGRGEVGNRTKSNRESSAEARES